MSYLLVFKVTHFSVCLGGIIYFYEQPQSTINSSWKTSKSSTPSEVISLLSFGVPVFFLTSPQMELKCSLYVEFGVKTWARNITFQGVQLKGLVERRYLIRHLFFFLRKMALFIFHYLIFSKVCDLCGFTWFEETTQRLKQEPHSSFMAMLMWLYRLAKQVKSTLISASI